ncbi:unnamed protein product [Protopolystoma xenopodis]|uniref:Uncharacterized protein n=1 Tax=Protopolystoma xenopodis TaxID=117903 RepID=A0A3S5BPX3_9PLAT|nr:unnamed protein product [Protopolystoma xenopodis]
MDLLRNHSPEEEINIFELCLTSRLNELYKAIGAGWLGDNFASSTSGTNSNSSTVSSTSVVNTAPSSTQLTAATSVNCPSVSGPSNAIERGLSFSLSFFGSNTNIVSTSQSPMLSRVSSATSSATVMSPSIYPICAPQSESAGLISSNPTAAAFWLASATASTAGITRDQVGQAIVTALVSVHRYFAASSNSDSLRNGGASSYGIGAGTGRSALVASVIEPGLHSCDGLVSGLGQSIRRSLIMRYAK